MDQPKQFATTQWLVVRQAADSDSGIARSALQELCQRYWFPIYSFVRWRGYDASEAEDLTQAFFADLIEREDIAKADPQIGRFRAFLLGSLSHFLANDWKKKNAKRRGGGLKVISLDLTAHDGAHVLEDPGDQTPDTAFDRRWAVAMLDRVKRLLKTEYKRKGKARTFEVLQTFLAGKSAESTFSDAATELGMTQVAVKVAAHRMRSRFGFLLRQEILATVSSEDEVDEEIQRLFTVLSSK